MEITMEIIIIALAIYIFLCYILVVPFAKKKGRDGKAYFFLAFITSPIFALIILLIVGDSDTIRIEKVKQEEEVRATIRKESDISFNTVTSSSERYASLEKLGTLLEKGFISKDEFEDEKQKILSDNHVRNNTEPTKDSDDFNEEIVTLKKIIDQEKNKGMFDKSIKPDIIDHLKNCCDTKDKGMMVIKSYNKKYDSDLIEDLKKLSTSYDGIKELVCVFIDLEIVNEKFPHELL